MDEKDRPQLIAPESVAYDCIADIDYLLRKAYRDRKLGHRVKYIKQALLICDSLLLRKKINDPETIEFLEEFSENTNE